MNTKHSKARQKYHIRKNIFTLFFILSPLSFTNCGTYAPYTGGTYYQLTSRELSSNNPYLRTCIFEPQYFIVHFPIYHFPADADLDPQKYEDTAQSQFQLLSTLLDYSKASHIKLSVFDENTVKDGYNPQYLQELAAGLRPRDTYTRVDGLEFSLQNLLAQAKAFFSHGPPLYYEQLSSGQKNFLVEHGAIFTLYFLGVISQIHKVIQPHHFSMVNQRVRDANGQVRFEGNDYWIFDFREMALREEVNNFRLYNPHRTCFIVYGAEHDLSDDFAGYPFQSGHDFCLNWKNNSVLPQI